MNDRLKTFLNFITTITVGAAIGFAGGYLKFKKRIQQFSKKVDAEVKIEKDLYQAKLKELENEITSYKGKKLEETKNAKQDSSDKVAIPQKPKKKGSQQEHNYNDQYQPKKASGEPFSGEDSPRLVPEVNHSFTIISDDEANSYNLEVVPLIYFSKDRILTDDDLNKISSPSTVVGNEALNSFGRYDDSLVYVLDNTNKVIYEISLDLRSYSDVEPYGADAKAEVDSE